jgi:hypothetical protein
LSPDDPRTTAGPTVPPGDEGDVVGRLATALLDAQRVLLAFPAMPAEEVNAHLARYAQETLPNAYRDLAEGAARYAVDASLVGAAYATEWLEAALPPERRAVLGAAPPAPQPPPTADPTSTLGWSVLVSTWWTQHQLWLARAFSALQEEVAAGRVDDAAVREATRQFLEDRWPDYVAAVTGLTTDLVSDSVAVVDETVRATAEHVGTPPRAAPVTTVTLDATAGAEAVGVLEVASSRPDDAVVDCRVREAPGSGLRVEPDLFRLAPGASRRLTVRAHVPSGAAPGTTVLGEVEISGHDEAPVVLRVHAEVREEEPRLSVRTVPQQP